jgi:hypothetical protein
MLVHQVRGLDEQATITHGGAFFLLRAVLADERPYAPVDLTLSAPPGIQVVRDGPWRTVRHQDELLRYLARYPAVGARPNRPVVLIDADRSWSIRWNVLRSRDGHAAVTGKSAD